MYLYNFHFSKTETSVSSVDVVIFTYVITLAIILLCTTLIIAILYYKSSANKSNPVVHGFSILFGDSLPHILKRHCQLLNIFNINDNLSKPKLEKSKTVKLENESQSKTISIYRPTLKVLVTNGSGKFAVARALLDTGSAYSYISPQLVHQINCSKRFIWPIIVSRFCGEPSDIVYQTATNVQLHSIENSTISSSSLELLLDFDDESKRTCRPPSKNLVDKLASVYEINLCDNNGDQAHYDLLIGQDLLHSEFLIDSIDMVKLTKDLSVLKTKFGSAVMGRWNDQIEFEKINSTPIANLNSENVSDLTQSCSMKVNFAPIWKTILVILSSTLIFLHLVFVIIITLPLILILKIIPYFKSFCEIIFSLYFSLVCLTTEFCCTFIFPYLQLPFSNKTLQYDQIPYSYQPTVYASVESSQHSNESVVASILLDTGSIYSYICLSLAKQLNCKLLTYGSREAVWVKLKNLSTSTELDVLLWVHESLQFKHCPRPSAHITQIVNSIQHSTVIKKEYCDLPKTYNIIIGSDLLSSVLHQSTVDKIHHNLVAHQTALGWVVQGANLNLKNPWNVLQNKTHFNLQAHFVSVKKLTCLWFLCLPLLWLDGLPFYLTLK